MKKFEWKTIKQRLGKGKKKIIAITVVICLVATGVGGAATKKNKSMAKDNGKAISAKVENGTIKEGISGTGTIAYADTTDIMVPSDLEIEEVSVSEGSYVEEGDILATVDETSLAVCIADIKEEISSLDSTITSSHSSTTTQYVTAGVSGTVEKIYGKVGDNVDDVMVENGALMLVKNGDETIKVIGSDGSIESINVSEGSSVSSSTKVMTLESEVQSGDYLQAVKDRDELVSVLETLLAIKKNGGITASTSGMIQAVNVTSKTSSSSGSSEGSASKTLGEAESTDDNAVHTISAVTLTCLSEVSATQQGTVTSDTKKQKANEVNTKLNETATTNNTGSNDEKINVLKSLKVEAGKIIGTTTAMEYAASEDADTWNSCTDQYTEVAKGTWYVRYKASETEAASQAVKVEVTEDMAADTTTAEKVNTSNNAIDSNTSNGAAVNTTKNTTTSNTSGSVNSNTSNSTAVNSYNDADAVKSSDNAAALNTTNTVNTNTTADANSTDNKSNTSSEGSVTTNVSASGKNNSSNAPSTSSSASKSQGSSGSKSGSSSGSLGSISGGSSSGSSSSSNSVASTFSAFTIANGDKMKVTMNVDELDILSVSVGLSAEISLDAVENKTFEGTITNVSGSASSSNGTAQYPVEITFDKTEEMLSGMNASVTVAIKEAKDVLIVPLAAITDEGKSSYVYTGYDESSGTLTGKTEVTLGMSDENNVEIMEGLSEGDTIYYEMKGSDNSDKGSGSGMPDMQGNFKMNGDMPSFDKSGGRPSGGGERPSGGNKPD